MEDALGRDYYEFMRFCDRLSLILCKDETPNAGRLLEINTSINKKQYFISKHDDGVLILSPWIFKTSPFDSEVEEIIIETPSFNSSKVFEKALENTCPALKKWTLIKS
ncbi:DUF3891 family protein [Lacinutrix neustonica]|uniref:DUF3891 family protein n=1 Tax=Lacinutrix neustonica TaxID=2980107 RepID=A0A9E8MY48_9FLAO|nr:DUF3891 family protein [Lacinutrix neustonica]